MGLCLLHSEKPLRILHVLANGPPDVNGYAVRTHSLLSSQFDSKEIFPIGLTSPWYPERETMIDDFEQDGVKYFRTKHPVHLDNNSGFGAKWANRRGERKIKRINTPKNNPIIESNTPFIIRATRYGWVRIKRVIRKLLIPLNMGLTWLEEKILFRYFQKRIIEVAVKEKSQIIHAHTPYRVGVPAMRAARKLKLPFVYEMRGMWEETAVANGRWKSWGPSYKRFRFHETRVLRKADAVICISETLRKEAISRGVNPKKISLVPNAVTPSDSDDISELFPLAQSKLENSIVVGYIGSLRDIEGVDATAEAVALLVSQGANLKFFVLSSQAGQEGLETYCKSLGIGDNTVIMGPVPHEEVAPFYDLIDVFVVSRPDTRVTRFVTPLKPFEAMQRGRALVMSDLPALAEIVEHGVTGLLYPPGDIDALSESILSLIENENIRLELGQNAKSWVEENRTWEKVIGGSLIAYKMAQK
ncbi:MAG TPA: glycosyltransferase [Candidatus Poseidoniales archaeon]|jgi:glycosyltransferase involved in cell wall biosynthesis|nr:glycosyltransferase [Candidatus Poseidoniales archaeon]